MIDINLIREHPDLVKKNIEQKHQQDKLPLVDKIINLDQRWKKTKTEGDDLRQQRNNLSKEVAEAKKANTSAATILKKAKALPKKLETNETKTKKLEQELHSLVEQIPNIMHKSVPTGESDKDNKVIQKFGAIKKFDFEVKGHVELAESLGMADFDSSAKTSGNGFYYLQGDLALLNQALLKFATDKMVAEGFTYVETPLLLRTDIISRVTDLHDQENMIYKIDNDDLALIGTSEHSLISRYLDQLIHEKDLPILQTSYSMCFRKEIGSHGIDEKGLFRTRQFNKIEMIAITKPEESMDYFEKFKKITTDIFTDLEIPIRVLAICSGDLGDLKHIQVDIDAYSPRRKDYFEVGSCSNLTEAQSRKLNIRGIDRHGERFTPHTLNNTAIATGRALVALLENHQNADGTITIPDALVPYMNGKKLIGKKD
ncbi:serine--tRNA ligase [Candidatus Pacearchaeota archaeon]|nr:serine--tRNA ligase [Candidatus Pacearchaeota archaeon]